MSLDYDLKGVKANYKDDAVWPITNALIWGTLSVGMNSITEKNWKEFYTRCHIIETIHGAWLYDRDGTRHITPKDVKSHIGLGTNVTNISNAKFKDDIDRWLRSQAKDLMSVE